MTALTGFSDPERDVLAAATEAATIPAGATVTAAALEAAIRAAEERNDYVRQDENDPELPADRRYAAGQSAFVADTQLNLFRALLASAT